MFDYMQMPGPEDADPPEKVPEAPESPEVIFCRRATYLAGRLFIGGYAESNRDDRAEGRRMERLLEDEPGKAFTFAMVDEVFRSRTPKKQAKRWRQLLQHFGVPRSRGWFDRLMIKLGAAASYLAPGPVMKMVEQRMREESSRVILPAEEKPLNRYLRFRTSEGVRINLNHLGEAVLGEEEGSAAHGRDPWSSGQPVGRITSR